MEIVQLEEGIDVYGLEDHHRLRLRHLAGTLFEVEAHVSLNFIGYTLISLHDLRRVCPKSFSSKAFENVSVNLSTITTASSAAKVLVWSFHQPVGNDVVVTVLQRQLKEAYQAVISMRSLIPFSVEQCPDDMLKFIYTDLEGGRISVLVRKDMLKQWIYEEWKLFTFYSIQNLFSVSKKYPDVLRFSFTSTHKGEVYTSDVKTEYLERLVGM